MHSCHVRGRDAGLAIGQTATAWFGDAPSLLRPVQSNHVATHAPLISDPVAPLRLQVPPSRESGNASRAVRHCPRSDHHGLDDRRHRYIGCPNPRPNCHGRDAEPGQPLRTRPDGGGFTDAAECNASAGRRELAQPPHSYEYERKLSARFGLGLGKNRGPAVNTASNHGPANVCSTVGSIICRRERQRRHPFSSRA